MESDQQRHLSPGVVSRGGVSQTSSTGSFFLESADHSTDTIQIHHSPPAGSGVKVCRQLGAQRELVPFSPYSLSRGTSAKNGRVDGNQQPGSQLSSQRPSRNSSHKSLLQANRSPGRQLSTDFSSSPYVLLGRKSPSSPLQANRTASINECCYHQRNNDHSPQLHQLDELTGSNETHALTASSNVASPTTPHPPTVPKNAIALCSFGTPHLHAGHTALTHSDTTTATAVGCNSRSASPKALNDTELEHYLDTTVTPSSTASPTGEATVPPSPAKWNLVESPQDATLLKANHSNIGVAERSSSAPRDVSPFIFSGATSASDVLEDGGVGQNVPTPPSSNVDTRSRGPSMLQVDSSQVSPANSRKGTASITTTTRSRLGLGVQGSYADLDAMDGWGVSRQVSYAYRTMSTMEDRRPCKLLSGAEIEDDGVGNCMIDDYLMNEEPFQKTQHSKVYLAYDTKKVMDTASSNKRAIKKIRLPMVEDALSTSVSRTNSQQSATGGVGAKEISDKDLQRLGREISIWKSLSNRYIVPLYKVLVSSDKRDAYLVMEYMEGGTLLSPSAGTAGDEDTSSDEDGDGKGGRQSLPQSPQVQHQLPPTFTIAEKKELNKCGPKQYEPLPLTEIQRYIEQLSGALTYLHGKGITHYDVKPENVLLTNKSGPTGRTEVRLTDFGTSELQNDKPTLEETTIASFSGSMEDMHYYAGDGAASRMASMGFRKNFIKGTHKFLAPEAFKPINESSPQADTRPLDMWALGVTLYAMATGHFPFKGTNVNAIRDSATHDTPYYPPSMEKAIKYLCERLLRKDPSTRWTAEKLYATLHKRRMDGALSTKPVRRSRRTSVSIPSVKGSSTTTSTPSHTNTPTHIQVGNEAPAHEAVATWRSRPDSVATVLTTGVVSSTSSSEVPLLSLGSPESRKHHQLLAARAAAAADPQNLSSAPVSRQPSEGGLLKLIRTQSNATDHTNLDAREAESISSLPCATHRSHHHLGEHTVVPSVSQERQPSSVHTTDTRDEDLNTSYVPSRNRSPLDSISNPPNEIAISHGGGPLEDGVDEGYGDEEDEEREGGAVDQDEAAGMQNSSNSGHSSDNYLNGDMFDGGTSFALSKEQQAWVMEQVLREARQGNNDDDMENTAAVE